MSLTPTWLNSKCGKVNNVVIVKTDRDGLSVRLSKTGKITFQFRYRIARKQKRIDLGTYPLLSLKDARDKVTELKSKLEKGYDPKLVLKSERERVLNAESFEQLYNMWHTSYCVKEKIKHEEIKRSFELHVFPSLGLLPIEDISLQHWLELLEPLAVETSSIADRVLTNAKQCLKWGIKRNYIHLNVLSDIYSKEDLLITKTPSKRVLDKTDIFHLWQAIEGSRMCLKTKFL